MSTHRLKHGSVVDAAKTKAHKGGTSLEKTESLTGEIRALDLFCGAGGAVGGHNKPALRSSLRSIYGTWRARTTKPTSQAPGSTPVVLKM